MSAYRNHKLLLACRKISCQHCGAEDGTVCAAHSNWAALGGKGGARKADDDYVAALCVLCHTQLDQGKTWTKAEKIEIWEAAHMATLHALIRAGLLVVKLR